MGNNLSTRVQPSYVVPFVLVLQNPFISSYLGQQHSLFPTPAISFSEVVSHISNTVRFSYHSLNSFLGSPYLLDGYF